ncbi:MAG: hypothetical protein M3044_04015 [Thermoproteota archaeon]|nr:hypothetical protein [Thermoproteota archaeon]
MKIPEGTFDTSFRNQEKSVYNIIEKYKNENNIARVQGQSLPVLIGIDNQTQYDINEITIEIIVNVKPVTASDANCNCKTNQVQIDFSRLDKINTKEYWNGLLFDVSGLHEVIIALNRVEYKINDHIKMPGFETNTPLLINTNDITNPYHGYRDQEEMQNYLLLENYIKSSFPARGILLKHMFKNLNEIIQNRSFLFEGEPISFSKEDLPVLQSIFQIDIIAKIMMYVEDLIIILEAILKKGGDYYALLDIDITKDRDVDVGDRIKKFFQDKDNFSMTDWRKMLSYLNPSNQIKYSNVIAKLIELNIAAFKEFINNIQIFSETHHRIFR